MNGTESTAAADPEKSISSVGKIPRAVYALMLIGLALRIALALNTHNVDHPDETFQYLEPAHRLVFGYGFIPWEFRFGARSWLIPFMISGPMSICKWLNVGDPTTYIPAVKIMFAFLSTSLTLSTYTICRNLKSERAGMFAAALCAFWYELIYFSFRPTADVVATYFLVAAFAFLVDRNKHGRPICFGLCAAMGAVLRFHYLPLSIFLHLLASRYWSKRDFIKGLIASATVVLLGGAFDFYTVGSMFGTIATNIEFNAIHKVGELFTAPLSPAWYFQALLATSSGALVLLAALSWRQRKVTLPLICFILLAVLVHSAIPTKFYRYIFVAIPILLSLSAIVMDDVIGEAGKSTTNANQSFRQWMTPTFFAVALFLSFAGFENWLPGEKMVYHSAPLPAADPATIAFAALAKENDVAGILMDQQLLWTSGGYYTLHHPVPIYNIGSDFSSCEAATPFISHMICREGALCPDMHEFARISDLSLGKGVKANYKSMPDWDYNLWQVGIDDKFKPAHHQLLGK